MAPTCCGENFVRFGTSFGISFLQTGVSLKNAHGSDRECVIFVPFGGGKGRGPRYFHGCQNFMNGAANNWRASVVDARPVDCSRRTFRRKPYMREPQVILYCIAHDSC